MLRRLAVGWLLLVVGLLPIAAPLTAESRASGSASGSACGEGRCCCAPEAEAAAGAGSSGAHGAKDGCCSSGESRALPRELQPSCACGSHGGAAHVAAAQVSLDLPAAGVALEPRPVAARAAADSVRLPTSRVPSPEPPPPRRAG